MPPPDYSEALAIAEAQEDPAYAAGWISGVADDLRYGGWVEEAKALEARVLQDFPESDAAANVRGVHRRDTGIGRLFELSFTDFVTGREINVQQDLAGKVVLIDFWGTWCAPCVGDLPNLRKLRRTYGDRGFEIVGIATPDQNKPFPDQRLRDFIDGYKVDWPQWYTGQDLNDLDKGFDFPRSWGVGSYPTHFILDAEGTIRSTTTNRADESEALVRQLLDERDAKLKENEPAEAAD